MMKKGVYYSLRPWHFKGGASFSIRDFQQFQYDAQEWHNCKWMYAFLILPPIWIILAFSVFVPRAKKMKTAANQLGILKEKENAISLMKAGKVAYEPSQEEVDAWNRESDDFDSSTEKETMEQGSVGKKKRGRGWGIVFLSIAAVQLITGIVLGLSLHDKTVFFPLVGNAAFWGCIGFILIAKAKQGKEKKLIGGKDTIPTEKTSETIKKTQAGLFSKMKANNAKYKLSDILDTESCKEISGQLNTFSLLYKLRLDDTQAREVFDTFSKVFENPENELPKTLWLDAAKFLREISERMDVPAFTEIFVGKGAEKIEAFFADK